ncbi:hypothetical protein ACKGJO_12075 [Gracilimonas sp. Q87]|uniref:hypothetical protein n=1 Tax=Gracilimonas sp. Q87 TaxID=3384766 RepID=UPI0039845150
MKFSLLILPVLLLLSIGCSTGQSIDDSNYETVLPEQLEVIEQNERSVTFKMSNSCGSACWANLQELIERDENTFEIKTVAEVTSEICTEQCVPYEREYTLEIPAPGYYTFQFIHRDSVYQSLDLSFP